MSVADRERSAGGAGNEALGPTALIAAHGANCLYRPEAGSAVRIRPPCGEEVAVVRDAGEWVLIRWCGKEAWSPRANLSASPGPLRVAVEVGATPGFCSGFRSAQPSIAASLPLNVEVGPRGGRYVRTASGFRRYL